MLTIEQAKERRHDNNRTAFQRRGASTPWGIADSATWFADGITLFSTPSHGGFRLVPERQMEMPESLRKRDLRYCGAEWFEEDCEACLVVVAFPDHFTADERLEALCGLLQWYPLQWHEYMATEHARLHDTTSVSCDQTPPANQQTQDGGL